MTQRLVVIGGGGFGREVLELIEDVNLAAGPLTVEPKLEVVGVLDDGTPDVDLLTRLETRHLGGTDALRDLAADVAYVIAIGGCAPRRAIDEKCQSWGRTPLVLVHPTVVVGRRSVDLGPGTIVCANSTITTNVTLGRHVHVNPNCSIGHDSAIGDYVTLTPQVAVAGHVTIHDRVFVGTGARILPEVVLGQDALVGAGAVVTKDIAPGSTVFGVPARPRGQ